MRDTKEQAAARARLDAERDGPDRPGKGMSIMRDCFALPEHDPKTVADDILRAAHEPRELMPGMSGLPQTSGRSEPL
jgi:hypothetical protein